MPAVTESGRPLPAAKLPPRAVKWFRVKGHPLKFVRFEIVSPLLVRVHGYVEHAETIDRVMGVTAARRYCSHLKYEGWAECDAIETPPRDYWWPAS